MDGWIAKQAASQQYTPEYQTTYREPLAMQSHGRAKRTFKLCLWMDMDMDAVREIRNLWQFFRDRRPEIYGDLTALQ